MVTRRNLSTVIVISRGFLAQFPSGWMVARLADGVAVTVYGPVHNSANLWLVGPSGLLATQGEK